MNKLNNNDFPTLSNIVEWGNVQAKFDLVQDINKVDELIVSNVNIIPYTGNKYVVFQVDNGEWELPGGTLEKDEKYFEALEREMMEELGAQLMSFNIFGQFHCVSKADKPYKPHIHHPNFVRLVGYGEVRIVGKPLNPIDGEQVISVEVVEIDEAIKRFEQIKRFDIAELYKLAHMKRSKENHL